MKCGRSLRKGIIPEEKVHFGPENDIEAPSEHELSAVVRNLKKNRAPREDSLTAELFTFGGGMPWRKIHAVVKRVWEGEQMDRVPSYAQYM